MRVVTLATLFFTACVARAATPDELRQRGLDALQFCEAHLRMPAGKYAALYADRVPIGADGVGRTFDGNGSCWAAGVMLPALNAAAALDPARVPAAAAYGAALDLYRFKPRGEPVGYQPYPGNRPDELFYDDNQWLVLAFLDAHRLTGDAAFLRRARDAFAYVASGESPDLGGGVWWSSKRNEKNACSNAPAICGALELYRATNDPALLAFAERLYAWVAKLQDPADGLYWDNVKPDGSIDKAKFSYNTALMIRANVLFFRVKGDAAYLATAQRLADAAEARWFRAADGAIADDGAFAHLLCEALLALDEAASRPASVARVSRALDHLATLARHGGYPKHWDGWRGDERRVELLQQASAARAYLVLAAHLDRAATRPAR